MKLDFSYTMTIEFDCNVNRQFFALRCIPQSNLRQQIKELQTLVQPDAKVESRVDGFGNCVMEGSIRDKSEYFRVTVEGLAEVPDKNSHDIQSGICIAEEMAKEYDSVFYSQTTGLTAAGSGLAAYARQLREEWSAGRGIQLREEWSAGCGVQGRDTGDFAEYIMHSLHNRLSYRKYTTDVNTTAEEAFTGGGGVCQDYAHIMIALLRIFGIPSRYVVGIMGGEGMSHAWVEVLEGEYWYGYDPTNDCRVADCYIKFSHGRDYRDCRINRGIFAGCAMQRQWVEAAVSEHEQ